MTTTQRMSDDEKWVQEYASAERRRQIAIGAAVFAAVAIVTVLVVAYFGSAAAIGGW